MFCLLFLFLFCSTECSNIWSSVSSKNFNPGSNSRSRSSHNNMSASSSRMAAIASLQLVEPYSQVPSNQPSHQPLRTSQYPSSLSTTPSSVTGSSRATNSYYRTPPFQSAGLLTASNAIVIPQAPAESIEYRDERPESPDSNSAIINDDSSSERISEIYLNNDQYNQFSLPDSIDRLIERSNKRRK
jgi:hypothetical protein